MSTKYPGGFITKSPVAPTTSAASGIWTLDQQQQAQKAGTWPSPPIFIEDLFSTYLYTGNGSTQTITNGIDLSGQGGLVWGKLRSTSDNNWWIDTVRGNTKKLVSNSTAAEGTTTFISSFNSNGFSIGDSNPEINTNGYTYVSWTFREQPKFFDIVTYTGTGAVQNIAHNLGSVPGCIIVKTTNATTNWIVQHRSSGGGTQRGILNSTGAFGANSTMWDNTNPTSSVFTVGTNSDTNQAGNTFVAYLFAHDAGGFPVSGGGSTNGISCGSAVIDGGGQATVNLGYEPQWILYKSSTDVQNWYIYDTMRGMPVGTTSGPYSSALSPNATTAEFLGAAFAITPTGFNIQTSIAGATYIYVAIRRGPMKTPTTGTSVYDPEIYTGDNSNTRVITTGFPPDMVWTGTRANGSRRVGDRLRGLFTNPGPISTTSSTSDEQFDSYSLPQMSGWQTGNGTVRFENSTGVDYVLHALRRAPGFFDVVCWTRSSSQMTLTHNLGTTPQLIIKKDRSRAGTYWEVLPNVGAYDYRYVIYLNDTQAISGPSSIYWGAAPTATTFDVNMAFDGSSNGDTFVAYLFATVAGVSKVGSYTGTGALQTVNCGFTSGARFVLIKRTDSTGGWYLYDSARGITSGNDPYLLINSSSAETTGTNYVDTDTTGFQVTAAAPSDLNANGGTFIFLAIA